MGSYNLMINFSVLVEINSIEKCVRGFSLVYKIQHILILICVEI